ncbi:MAG: site-2 protease family protein [Hadesarchaea archaeon]|nr:site-2 protease family protein [Hadesarchaea archaeon]
MKEPVAKLKCTSCGHVEYGMTSKSVGETLSNNCYRCHGDMTVEDRGELPKEFNKIGELVSDEFHIWDFRMTSKKLEFLIESDAPKEPFSNLLSELREMGYIAALRSNNGDLGIVIQKSPEPDESNVWLNVILFLGTVVTTFLFAGYFLLYNDYFYAALFSASLLTILVSHELGHKMITWKYKVSASLPYFIPAPTLIGTLGAIIKTKSPIPSKKALVEMGASGPVIGFLISLPIAAIGLALSEPVGGEILKSIPPPLIFTILGNLILEDFSTNLSLHPLAFAGLIGIFVTWLNLMPAGQLDGGHVTRGLLNEEKHFFLGRIIGFTLVLMGFIWIIFLFWGLLVLFIFGKPHSGALDDVTDLPEKHKLIAFFALIIFILCLPLPI